jgi:exosortase
MQSLVEAWRHDPYYGHGYIVFLISSYFFVKAYKETKNKDVTPKPQKKNILYLFFCIVALFVSAVYYGASLGNFLFTLVILLSVKLLAVLKWGNHSEGFNFPLLFFLFAVPLPFLGDILFYLQLTTAITVTAIVQFAGFECVREALLVKLETWSFVVGDSCSGFSSSIVLLSLIFLLTHILLWPKKKQAVLLLLVLPVAFVANVLRILFLVVVGNMKGPDVAFDYWHDIGGLSFYLLALLGLIGIVCLLNSKRADEKIPV